MQLLHSNIALPRQAASGKATGTGLQLLHSNVVLPRVSCVLIRPQELDCSCFFTPALSSPDELLLGKATRTELQHLEGG